MVYARKLTNFHVVVFSTNKHVYNEANKILPEDTESTMNAKMMAENLIVNIILN